MHCLRFSSAAFIRCSLNQLLCIATQIREDIRQGSHKYVAHKLALLYQAVNLSKVRRDELRKRIEEHFEDVKARPSPATLCMTCDAVQQNLGPHTHPLTSQPPARQAATESQPEHMSVDLISWLAQLCDDVIALVRETPPSLPQKLLPVLRFMHA